ncbi:hypothetical protein M427DRAFT_236086 [Gonapodya prolifera JEL478]|uniref:Uncharacterized protein n=1 Tax=Gonapodya prolifera (strain JEL478) TaxID=1344416 RepID=A0A139AMI0_GONPJ|nr:hypothetical protein M427DRAFT_236086 [Gonapodya prolifera JEL478]|eukprot:KXS17959.1 hypothetical protein M427DRAFT_236086 [Gonapodya prolifera JEL478]
MRRRRFEGVDDLKHSGYEGIAEVSAFVDAIHLPGLPPLCESDASTVLFSPAQLESLVTLRCVTCGAVPAKDHNGIHSCTGCSLTEQRLEWSWVGFKLELVTAKSTPVTVEVPSGAPAASVFAGLSPSIFRAFTSSLKHDRNLRSKEVDRFSELCSVLTGGTGIPQLLDVVLNCKVTKDPNGFAIHKKYRLISVVPSL